MLAGIPFAYLTLPEAQLLAFTSTEVISSVLVSGELGALPAGLASLTSDEVVDQTLQPLEGAIASIDLVRALLWIVAAIIVGAVVYLSALDRQRDFAVLKAVGTPNSSLLGSLALQAVLIALGAVRSRRSSRSSSRRSSRCRSRCPPRRSGSCRCWRW